MSRGAARFLIAVMVLCSLSAPTYAGPAASVNKKEVACKKEARAKKIALLERKAYVKDCVAKAS